MWRVDADKTTSRTLLRAGLGAGPLFIAVFTLDGATRPDYRPGRHPISSLALGSRGWLQTANFALTGALYLGGAAALSRTSDPAMSKRAGPWLIGAAAAGIVGAAAFTTDPVSGYPPGTPNIPTERTTAGAVHDLVAIPTFFGLPMAAAAYSWRFARHRQPGWATYSASTTVLMFSALGMSAAGFNQSARLVDTAGRRQRLHRNRIHLAHRSHPPGASRVLTPARRGQTARWQATLARVTRAVARFLQQASNRGDRRPDPARELSREAETRISRSSWPRRRRRRWG